MSFFRLEKPCETIHVASQNVAVFTCHETYECISSDELSENGIQKIELKIKGTNLDDEKVRIGFGATGWQEREKFQAVLGSTNDSWALSSGGFYHNGETFSDKGFPIDPYQANIFITFDREQNKVDFWLDGQNINVIRNLPKNRFQILICLQNASVQIQIHSESRNWAPKLLDFSKEIDELKKENKIKNRYNQFIKEIRQSVKKGGSRINILMVGEPGVGKSSFINSIMTACSSDRASLQDVIPFASVSDQRYVLEDEEKKELSSHTRKITSYRLGKSSIHLWDSFGMASKGPARYLTKFSSIMEGKLRPGYNKDLPGVDQPDYVIGSKNLEYKDRIHCVFVVINGETLMDDDDGIFDTPREFIDAAQNLYNDGLRVLVLLTKVDVIGKNQFIDGILEKKFNMRNVYKNPLIYEKVRLVKRKLGVGMNQIIPIQNYSSSEETESLDIFKELFHFRAVTLAITYAQMALEDDDSDDDDDDDDKSSDDSDDSSDDSSD